MNETGTPSQRAIRLAELPALVAYHAGAVWLDGREAPVQRVTGFDTIMPYYKLELDYMPDATRVGRAILDALAY